MKLVSNFESPFLGMSFLANITKRTKPFIVNRAVPLLGSVSSPLGHHHRVGIRRGRVFTMNFVPRLALASADPAVDHRPLLWGILQHLKNSGVQSQCFYSQSRFPQINAAASITGRVYRHLDPWLMSPEVCRDVMLHGMHGAELAIVESACMGEMAQFDELCQWLTLPRLSVVDVSSDDPCRTQMPKQPIDGILLSGVSNLAHFAYQRTRLEAMWGAPVLGGLIACPHVCAILQRLPAGACPSNDLCRALSNGLLLVDGLDRLLPLAQRHLWNASAGTIYQQEPTMAGLKIAIALDDAFECYFADSLDLLAAHGATLMDFSPLNDADLPTNVDAVYLGGGSIEKHALDLAANPCMIAALRRYARSGGRVYAEGSAVGYLCSQVEVPRIGRVPMTGLLPAVAKHELPAGSAQPSELVLSQSCWLSEQGERLRGYRDCAWQIKPTKPLESLTDDAATHLDLVRRGNVIASRLQLNLVAQPHLLNSLLNAAFVAGSRLP